ncbi:Putative SGNH hydrolase-type esterase domain, SGNH hydrolase superfamily [Septoria linicola]|uniref:SGNH hydrolase-type esterase domain, SGNH hydrolase superfamily n=1 Tax=Septoria linicola TaxID=215465 RepID=A0A9Q9AV72_9PEZI|nr:putative SGNH hydrolase-type esterase domain, SGNH hydrolase superfamily [Septoria linicola]USW52587.1 Putative SGNH hydrolase-type esterase domain, SGNH hydrolase superfamily [Septoria linicola]
MNINIKLSSAADNDITMVQELYDTEQFLLFGDSITQHSFSQERGFAFGAALANEYVRRLDVINRGFSGYNTRQALEVLPHVIPPRSHSRVRFMTVWFGANDARLPDTPGEPQQHIPLDEYVDNTRAVLTHPDVRGHEEVRIILITPPPVDERKGLASDQAGNPNNGNVIRRRATVTRDYAAAIVKLGEEQGVQVLDLWSIMIRRAGGVVEDPVPVGAIEMPQNDVLQSFLYDGLHLSPEGYEVLFEETMALIKKVWPDQNPDGLPFVLPRWDAGVWQR